MHPYYPVHMQCVPIQHIMHMCMCMHLLLTEPLVAPLAVSFFRSHS